MTKKTTSGYPLVQGDTGWTEQDEMVYVAVTKLGDCLQILSDNVGGKDQHETEAFVAARMAISFLETRRPDGMPDVLFDCDKNGSPKVDAPESEGSPAKNIAPGGMFPKELSQEERAVVELLKAQSLAKAEA
jgi:hypothetical protein